MPLDAAPKQNAGRFRAGLSAQSAGIYYLCLFNFSSLSRLSIRWTSLSDDWRHSLTFKMKKRVLTGINTTGTLHIGNYVGAIRPAIQDSRNPDVESFFFLADLHALIKCQDPNRIERSRMQIAATWLAAGLDPDRVIFYRQSDIPEIPLLNWMLSCCMSKGLLNRAHAYKAAVDKATAEGRDPDADVSMGLFCYPVLMAADILMFNANEVPVGHDQLQHLEMARDAASRFNNLYAEPNHPFFVMPQATGGSNFEVLPGLDGRKMSKSYNNVIPLFEGGRPALEEAISRIVTDSRLPGEPKDPDSNSISVIFRAFATPEATEAFREELRNGLGWGEAKARLVAQIDREIGPMRARYEELMAHPEIVEAILQEGARKARAYATPFIEKLRHAVGLRSFTELSAKKTAPVLQQAEKKTEVLFKQYREADGRFYFKLVQNGQELLVSQGFESGRDAGQWVARLKKEGASALPGCPVIFAAGVDSKTVDAALSELRAAEAAAKAAKAAKVATSH